MKKFKAILLGVLSFLTLVLFVVTGTKVNAETDLTYNFNIFSDTPKNNQGETITSQDQSASDWYVTKTTSMVDYKQNYYSSAVKFASSKVNKIGDISSGTFSGIASFFPSTFVAETRFTYGLAVAAKDITNAKTVSISLSQSKGQNTPSDSKGGWMYFVIAGNNNKTILIDEQMPKAAKSYTFNLDITKTNDVYYVSDHDEENSAKISIGDSNVFSYYVLFASDKNLQINSWQDSLTIQTSQQVQSTHNVYYHDIDGNIISSLTQQVADNTNTTVPESISSAPAVLKKKRVEWRIGSVSGNAVGNTINMVESDIDLYAYYENDENYVVNNAFSLNESLLGAVYNEGFTTISNTLTFTDTNYQLIGSNGSIAKQEIDNVDRYFYLSGGQGDTTKRCFIATLDAGFLTVVADRNGTGNATSIVVTDGKTNGYSEEFAISDELKQTPTEYVFEIPTSGTYYIYATRSARIFSTKFEATPEVEVTALQQEAVDGDSTYIRFVFIVSNDTTLATADFANKLTLILDEDEATEQSVTRSPKAYNKLTLAGNTYVATVKGNDYTFDNAENPDDIYVVYVVQFTTSKYTGHNVKASLNVGGTEYKTSGYDFK